MPRLSRKPLWLAACALLAAAACLASFSRPAEGGCGPQQSPSVTSSRATPTAQPVPTAGGDKTPPVFHGSAPDATGSPLPPIQPHTSPTLDQLLDRLAAVKAQKEQLDREGRAGPRAGSDLGLVELQAPLLTERRESDEGNSNGRGLCPGRVRYSSGWEEAHRRAAPCRVFSPGGASCKALHFLGVLSARVSAGRLFL